MSGIESTTFVDENSTGNIKTELTETFRTLNPQEINFNVNDNEFQKIGEGSYGIIFKTLDKVTGNTLTLKKIKNAFTTEGMNPSAMSEISLLKQLHHINIIKLHQVIMVPNALYMMLEYVDHNLKSMLDLCKKNVGVTFSEFKIKSYLYQILKALDYCHSQYIIHLDLQPKNILVYDNDRIKLTNFKSAKRLFHPVNAYMYKANSWYTSPEMLLGAKNYTTAVDLWSLGCIFAEMISIRTLFPAETKFNQIITIFDAFGTPSEDTWPGLKKFPHFSELYPKMSGRPVQHFIPEITEDQINIFNASIECFINRTMKTLVTFYPYLKNKISKDVHIQMVEIS